MKVEREDAVPPWEPPLHQEGKEYLVPHRTLRVEGTLYFLHLSPPSLCLSWNSSTSQEQRAWEENKELLQCVQPIF